MKVPFVDLQAQYQSIKGEIHASIASVIAETAFIGGKYVEQFEQTFAAYCGCRYAVGVSSGTSAIHLGLIALGIGRGDEVVTAANTFIATTEAAGHAGASFRLVDIDEATYHMDPRRIEEAITERTKAILPVHLYGQVVAMDPIMDVARKHGLAVVEDACQAHGAEYRGKRAGSFGAFGAFSFYPAKNLGAYGDAGVVVTDDKDVADRVRLLANHGRRGANDHAVEGFNERLDGIQAAILSAKLPHLDRWNDLRREAAARYNRLLAGLRVATPLEMPDCRHVYHLYVIRVRDRDRVRSELQAKGVSCGLHYPIPLHLLDAYRHLGMGRGSFPAAERAAEEILSLPMYAEITEEQQAYVAKCLEEVVGRKA